MLFHIIVVYVSLGLGMRLLILSVFKQNENVHRNMEIYIYKCAVKERRSRQK
jgi:hypothetical protein